MGRSPSCCRWCDRRVGRSVPPRTGRCWPGRPSIAVGYRRRGVGRGRAASSHVWVPVRRDHRRPLGNRHERRDGSAQAASGRGGRQIGPEIVQRSGRSGRVANCALQAIAGRVNGPVRSITKLLDGPLKVGYSQLQMMRRPDGRVRHAAAGRHLQTVVLHDEY